MLAIDWIVYNAVEALRISAILLLPVMPAKMGELLDALGVEPGNRGFEHAKLGADFAYGVPIKQIGKAPWGALFPPAASEK